MQVPPIPAILAMIVRLGGLGMFIRWICACLLAAGTIHFGAQRAEGQTVDNALRGLKSLRVMVEELDGDDAQCGVDERSVRSWVLYPVTSTPLQITDDRFAPATLWVNLTSLYFQGNGLCVYAYVLRLRSFQKVVLEATGQNRYAGVVLWERSGIQSAGRSAIAANLRQTIDEFARAFVVDWRLDQ